MRGSHSRLLATQIRLNYRAVGFNFRILGGPMAARYERGFISSDLSSRRTDDLFLWLHRQNMMEWSWIIWIVKANVNVLVMYIVPFYTSCQSLSVRYQKTPHAWRRAKCLNDYIENVIFYLHICHAIPYGFAMIDSLIDNVLGLHLTTIGFTPWFLHFHTMAKDLGFI